MKRISAVIVTFNNSKMLMDLLTDLSSQTRPPEEIIVVDNASIDNTEKMVQSHFPDVRYIRLPENTGSAGGYHEGIRAALENSDLIWTLDDDVRLARDSLEELLSGFEELDLVLSLSSVRSVGKRRTEAVPHRLELFPWRGTLIKSEVIRECGLPMKELFIYGEDLEYAMRFNQRWLYCYWIPQSICVENRTEGKIDYVFMGKTTRIYSSSFQLYYAFRNNTYVFWRYGNYPRLLRTLLYAIKSSLFLIIFEKRLRAAKTHAIAHGVLDGFRGRLGKNPQYLPAVH
jgi:rhamnopyranosyl-N-acetylglucosaminyl-diphospho-decaprenol beta-1,3/1,4-galactofuranosyltransferase